MPWDLVSSAYAEEVVPLFEAFSREALRRVAPGPSSRIIDVACGPGTLSVLAAQAGHRVEAIDFSPQMIEQLTRRIGPLPIHAQVADGQALPFSDDTFDAGFSMFGLMFFPDRAAGLAELSRVLRPGAKAVVSSWPPLDNIAVFAAMFAAIREAMFKALGSPPAPQTEAPLGTVEACRAEMSASFDDVEVQQFATVQTAASADALWDTFTRTMAPIVMMKKNLGDKFAPIDDAARAAIRDVVGTGPVELELTAHMTIGTAR
jgi:ubiquinone/menaquinone biosynthesis C-methylase UbiE